MWLSEMLYEDLIKVDLEAKNKWEAIEELTDLLISLNELSLLDRDEVINALFTRERSLSTGMQHGLAIPHGVTTCNDTIIAALGTSKRGIPFESLDGQAAQIIVLLLIPKGRFQKHVTTLAGIAKISNTPDARKKILEANTAEELMSTIIQIEEGFVN